VITLKQTERASITGRDNYILAQALAYASEWLATLDVMNDEPSNREHMDAILDEIGGHWAGVFRYQAKVKLGVLEPVPFKAGRSVAIDRTGIPVVLDVGNEEAVAE
jgi:hypothetical protein